MGNLTTSLVFFRHAEHHHVTNSGVCLPVKYQARSMQLYPLPAYLAGSRPPFFSAVVGSIHKMLSKRQQPVYACSLHLLVAASEKCAGSKTSLGVGHGASQLGR